MITPNKGSKSIACKEPIMAPRKSFMLSEIPLMREVRRSMPRSDVCEKSLSVSSQLSNAVEVRRQLLKLPFSS